MQVTPALPDKSLKESLGVSAGLVVRPSVSSVYMCVYVRMHVSLYIFCLSYGCLFSGRDVADGANNLEGAAVILSELLNGSPQLSICNNQPPNFFCQLL